MPSESPPQSVHDLTGLLSRWSGGDKSALEELMPLVYPELHRLARHYMRGERNQRLLQPTALLHDVYVRFLARDQRGIEWHNRSQFFAAAASAMRHVLVDAARSGNRAKRGGVQISLNRDAGALQPPTTDLLDVDAALHALAEFDERKARIIELRYFGGLTQEETAAAIGVSLSTVKRDNLFAEAWLRCYFRGEVLTADIGPAPQAPGSQTVQ